MQQITRVKPWRLANSTYYPPTLITINTSFQRIHLQTTPHSLTLQPLSTANHNNSHHYSSHTSLTHSHTRTPTHSQASIYCRLTSLLSKSTPLYILLTNLKFITISQLSTSLQRGLIYANPYAAHPITHTHTITRCTTRSLDHLHTANTTLYSIYTITLICIHIYLYTLVSWWFYIDWLTESISEADWWRCFTVIETTISQSVTAFRQHYWL